MPLAVGVEVDAEDAANEDVGIPEESIVGDEHGWWLVGIGAVEPQLDVLVVVGDQDSGIPPGVPVDPGCTLVVQGGSIRVRNVTDADEAVVATDSVASDVPSPEVVLVPVVRWEA